MYIYREREMLVVFVSACLRTEGPGNPEWLLRPFVIRSISEISSCFCWAETLAH